jgi:phosphoglycolate phosphatase
MKYEAYLFDLDGTLTDSAPGILNSYRHALSFFGIEMPGDEETTAFLGPPLRKVFREYFEFSEKDIEQAVLKFREYLSEKGIYENELYPGIERLLDDLKAEGKVIALATSKVTSFAERILKHFGIDGYFDFIGGDTLEGTRGSKPEVISYVLESLDIEDKSKVVMIGDREFDIIGAREVGIDSIGVTYGYGSHEELKKAKPTIIMGSVEELRELF